MAVAVATPAADAAESTTKSIVSLKAVPHYA